MDTSSLSALTGNGVDSTVLGQATTGTNALGKDAFLKLLISQLQNQDPLNPADSTEFTAQLAQFSSLEQLSNVNETLNDLKLYQASINNAQAVSFIGKEILAIGNEIEKKPGQPLNCEYELGADAKEVVVNIYDADGNLVAEVRATGQSAGRQSIAWDGRDSKGNKTPDGMYTFKIQAEDADGNPVAASTLTRGKVTGVTFDGFTPVLMIGERRVAFGSVLQIIEANT